MLRAAKVTGKLVKGSSCFLANLSSVLLPRSFASGTSQNISKTSGLSFYREYINCAVEGHRSVLVSILCHTDMAFRTPFDVSYGAVHTYPSLFDVCV